MKKLLAAILSSIVLLLTCGCSFKPTFSAGVQESIVSALGFSETENGIEAYLETIAINSEALDGEKELKILKGNGKTAFEAVAAAKSHATQGLELSHCAVVIIDNSISPAVFEKICEYCYNETEITLSVIVVCTKNSEKLLECSPSASVAVGYDIVSMLENISLNSGVIYKNRFYELAALKEKPLNTFALPLLKADKEAFTIEGLTVFSDFKQTVSLNTEQTHLYSIITDNHSSGEFFINNNRYKLSSVKVKYDFKYNQNLNIILSVNIDSEKGNPDEIKSNLLKELENSKGLYSDIFGFANLLQYFNAEIWHSIKNDYANIYKNSIFTVNLK